MPFIISLVDPDGKLYEVPEHDSNFRATTVEGRGRSSISLIYTSNIDAWKYRAINSYWDGEGYAPENLRHHDAHAAAGLMENIPSDDVDDNEIAALLMSWAILHPEGRWDCG